MRHLFHCFLVRIFLNIFYACFIGFGRLAYLRILPLEAAGWVPRNPARSIGSDSPARNRNRWGGDGHLPVGWEGFGGLKAWGLVVKSDQLWHLFGGCFLVLPYFVLLITSLHGPARQAVPTSCL